MTTSHREQVKITRADLKGVHKDVIEIALLAIDYGWSAKHRSTGGFSLTCRCGEHHAYIPSGTKQGHIAKQLLANIERCPRNLSIKTEIDREVLTKGVAKKTAKTAQHLTAPVKEQIETDGPKLVSERPHMSKKGERRGRTTAYESPVTIEQVWSDGVVSFRCKFCDFGGRDQRNARSVANHSGNMHKNPENRLAQQDVVEIEEYIPPAYTQGPRTYNPSERLLRALDEFLAEVWEENMDPTEAARLALTWFHDRPDLGDPELRVRSSEPKTPEEQIAAIRTLVDGGRYDRLEAEIVRLTAALEIADAEKNAAVENALKLRTRLERVTEELMEGL